MIFIFGMIILALYVVAIISAYQNMFAFDKTSKIVYLIIGFLIISVVTVILSKVNLQTDNKELIKMIQRSTQIIFVPLNALITLPVIANIMSKYKTKAIAKEKLRKRILIITVIYIIFFMFEKNYITNFQTGVLSNINR